jgi:LacI family transcriptional regulator
MSITESNAIALLVDRGTDHYSRMAMGLMQFCLDTRAFRPICIWSPPRAEQLEQLARTTRGIVAVAGDEPSLIRYLSLGLPLICVSTRFDNQLSHEVVPDNRAIGRSAAGFFIARSYRHLATASMEDYHFAQDRRAGFEERAAEAGLEVRSFRDDLPAFREGIRALPSPAAVYGVSDRVAVEVVRAAASVRARCPNDLAVLGTDDDLFSRSATPVDLASIPLQSELIGYEAGQLMRELLGRKKARRRIVRRIPPGEVVVRQSADQFGHRDPLLVKALRMMGARFSEPISVDDIARGCAASKRSLQLHFAAQLGHGPKEELLRIRLNEARRLLPAAPLSLDRIAEKTGFGSTALFGRHFREAYGETPGAYRKRMTLPRPAP